MRKLISDDPAFTGPHGPDILGDLEFLQHHWGSAYLIGAEDGGYTADRRDGKGSTLSAADRDGLMDAIQADYTADPVPRDLAQDVLRGKEAGRGGARASRPPEGRP